jgi:Mn-containing catalase
MAIAYLTQAVNDTDPIRKATLVRIARRKIRHADILGAILIQIAKGTKGPLPTRMDRKELSDFLFRKGFKTNYHEHATVSLTNLMKEENRPTGNGHYLGNPKDYLMANILSEEKQILIYQQLTSLTSEANYVSALNYVKAAQIQHREDLIELRDRVIQ